MPVFGAAGPCSQWPAQDLLDGTQLEHVDEVEENSEARRALTSYPVGDRRISQALVSSKVGSRDAAFGHEIGDALTDLQRDWSRNLISARAHISGTKKSLFYKAKRGKLHVWHSSVS
jgi:hypothetical protein